MKNVLLPLTAAAVVFLGVLLLVSEEKLTGRASESAATSSDAAPDSTHTAHPGTETPCLQQTPLGALPPAVPVWCSATLADGSDTHRETANSWTDDFNHGQQHAALSAAYVQGSIGDGQALHFLHNDHWMVDIQTGELQYPTMVAAWMRPNRTFRPDDAGRVVLEFEVAGPIAGTRNVDGLGDSWPEIVLSTAAAPAPTSPEASSWRPNGTYLYEAFPSAWTFGCRIQQSRHPICALYKPDTDGIDNYAGGPDRLWEINQNGGDVRTQKGGDPGIAGLASAWKTCDSAEDPDTKCRNKFRLELQADHLLLLVNGVPYYEAQLIDTNLRNILEAPGGFYVYFGDFAYRISGNTALRFHWDHLAINPG